MAARQKCRFLNSGFNDGFHNMAVDGALLHSAEERLAPPTLRFYGWEPPAVSIGYFQDEEEFRKLPGYAGRGIVKRLTGGGAIFHDSELTFSLVCREEDCLLPRDVFLSYGAVCAAMEVGLSRLGITACRRGGPSSGNPVSGAERKTPYFCFEKPSSFDVAVSGRKLAGSAQRRRRGAVLHHGSILLERKDSTGAVTVKEAAGRPVSFNELSHALLEGFGEALGVEFFEGELSGFENEIISLKTGGKL